jgi:polar amino acid transport system substrate-binding protein
MKVATRLGLLLVLSVSTGAWAVEDVMKQLVPTGKLRVGVAYAPALTPIFVAKDAAGDVHGVPRDLGNALAKTLGVPVEIVVVATTGELTDACSSGAIDIGFMPTDDERALISAALFCDRKYFSRRRPVCHQDTCGRRSP